MKHRTSSRQNIAALQFFALLSASVAIADARDPLADPLLTLDQDFESALGSRTAFDQTKCTFDFLRTLGMKFHKTERTQLPPAPEPCRESYAPIAEFQSSSDASSRLNELLDGPAARCLYQLRVSRSIQNAAKLMNENPAISFATKPGKVHWLEGGKFRTEGGFFFKCRSERNQLVPFKPDPSIPWGCLATDPCDAARIFLGHLQGYSVQMDCSNAVIGNQLAYTFLKFDFNGDGILDPRECRLFTDAYSSNDPNQKTEWSQFPISLNGMSKHPFIGPKVKRQDLSGQELAKKGAPYLSAVRAAMTIKADAHGAAKEQIARLRAERDSLRAKSSRSPAESQRLERLEQLEQDARLKENFLNENLLITRVSESAARQWSEAEVPGDNSRTETVGQLEKDYERILSSVREIRGKRVNDVSEEIHVAEALLAREDSHQRLLDPRRFPLRSNGKRDFSALRSLLEELEPQAKSIPIPGQRIVGRIDSLTVRKMEDVLEVLLQPRYREVEIYSHPQPKYAENRNLSSLLLRQFGAHRNRPLTLIIYPDTEQTDQYERFRETFIDDCKANLKSGSAKN